MSEKRWVVAEPDRAAGDRLARALNVSPITAALLINRGVCDTSEARNFLYPDLASLIDPMRFEEMGAAVDRLERAVKEGERVGIFGDYDVDGTSATAILAKLLGFLGNPPTYRVPHRVKDGYGMNAKAVEAFAKEGAKVLITVDCGTNNPEEIALARARGMDVIVVDHHEAGTERPDALAILNPKVKGSGYGFTGICSAGIAFKLAWALADRMGAKRMPGFDGYILDVMGLAALGTVADVCPLIAENRVVVRYGLDALRACKSPGLRALLDLANVGEKPIDTFDISFKLAPRLNALGRIGTAMDTVDLMVSDDPVRIGQVLKVLERANKQRKDLEDAHVKQAVEQVEAEEDRDGPIVVADERWHLGVVGIVAARLVDRYHRPAFVLAIANGVARGSGRSIEGVELHEALAACSEHLLTHGGHAMAVGLSLETKKLDRFRRKMRRQMAGLLTAERVEPKLEIDAEVPVGAITRPVVRELERFAPHGPANPEPILVSKGVKVAGQPRLIGRRNNHLDFYVTQGGASIRVVGFGMGKLLEPLERARSISVAFTPQVNRWRGRESVELRLRDVKFEE